MASSTGAGNNGREQEPITALQDVIKYILRAVPIAEATLDSSGMTALKPGFATGHNPPAGLVLVEALGYGESERLMLDRYKTAIIRAFRSVLGGNPSPYVRIVETASKGAVLQVSGLTTAQIARLKQRYSTPPRA